MPTFEPLPDHIACARPGKEAAHGRQGVQPPSRHPPPPPIPSPIPPPSLPPLHPAARRTRWARRLAHTRQTHLPQPARSPVAPSLGLPDHAAYCASKAAVSTLTEAFSKELAAKKITVNAVAPGATITPMTAWLSDDIRRGIEQSTPLGRMAIPADIADVVLFLASEKSRWITGRTILIDGGLN